MRKRVLVTGGAGFLGSHLCKKLLDSDCEVFCLDNFFSGRRENVKQFETNGRFHMICQDVNIPIYMEVDEIYHLACPASPVYYQIDPIWTLKTAVTGTTNMLELAKKTGAKILITSTSEVYGDPLVHPQPETYFGNVNILGPRSCYDVGKRCGESMAVAFAKQHDIDVKIVRIFNTYGPNMSLDDGRVMTNFVMQAINNKPITVYGNGAQTRSFCYASDLISGLIRMMQDGPIADPINLGNPDEITILQLAEMIIKETKSQSEIINVKLPKDDPKIRRPDITKAKEMLGWSPAVSLDVGLKSIIEDVSARNDIRLHNNKEII